MTSDPVNATTGRPLFSVITPVYETPSDILQKTIESVRAQSFGNWELILVDDRSPSERVRQILRRAAGEDPRVRVAERADNGGISAASNDAVALARGEFLALLDHDDLLTPNALEAMAKAIEANPDADYLYSDEDKVDVKGRYGVEFRKPPWSPERLRSQMYTCHLSVLRTALVREVGGFDGDFNGSQDHDLVLRVTEKAREVVHVPEILYHWRILPGSSALAVEEKPYAWEAGRRAVQAHLDRVGIAAKAEFGPVSGTYRIERSLPEDYRVSIVIPTRGTSGRVWDETRCFVVEAVRSALATTHHANLEIVVVYDEGTPEAVLDELRGVVGPERAESERVRPALVLVPFRGEFNFSAKCNTGFLASTGDAIVLLNDDVEVVSPRWLENLVGPVLEPDVGLSGAQLLFSDGTVQHGGHIYAGKIYTHAFYGVAGEDIGLGIGYALAVNRECSGVTAACVAVRRSVFEEVGGLCEDLPVNYNDVDFCLKVADAGYRNLWIANVVLYHFESKTREPGIEAWETELVERRWDSGDSPGWDLYLPVC